MNISAYSTKPITPVGPSNRYVIGTSLEYDGYSVSRIFARHSTKAAINVSGHAIVTIDAFDDSCLVVAVSGENTHVSVNLYGNAHAECIGLGMKVRFMQKDTY